MRLHQFGVLAVMLAALACPRLATAAVTMSSDAADPALGPDDQYSLVDDQQIPNGNTPGGGTYNSQSYSDNAGPPGQTFTTPAGAPSYLLTSVSMKGTGDTGGGAVEGQWGVRISAVSGTSLTPLNTVTGIVGAASATADDWLTWAFSDADVLSLSPGTQYAFEVFSSSGWFGFGGAPDSAYGGGTAFNSAGPSRSFGDDTLGNLANHGYDRTFHVALTAVPEPAAIGLALGSAVGLLAWRRKR
ncbi:MAG: hypothetical protein KF688_17825 [Pirellulales bacterium]|nr:hypothetical protein [Pirellulales bacterium]